MVTATIKILSLSNSAACVNPRKMNRGYHFISGILLIFCLQACIQNRSENADLILINAKIWTGQAKKFSEAVALRGNTIIRVGSTKDIQRLSSENTRVIDVAGKLVIPGFNDAHIHFLGGSIGLTEVELSTASSLEEIRKRIKEFADANPSREWITGRGWLYTLFPGGMPTKAFLDTLNIDRPIYLRAYDGHSALANSHALELAGIKNTFEFDGYGEIIRDSSGEPTGALTEHAQSLISKIIPPLTREDKLNALRSGLKLAASLGITSIQNASGSIEEFSLYEELYASDELTLRTSTAFSVNEQTTPQEIAQFIETRNRVHKNPMIHAGAVKFMLDGVIESHTAAMIEPYSDLESNGSFSMPLDTYKELVATFDSAGFQIYTHAIGDLAVREALNAYEHARKQNGTNKSRHRIEHIEMIDPADFPRFNSLGVLPSMEPIHAEPGTSAVWSKAVGEKRLPYAFAWASLLQHKARLVYSSDWPACISLDPIHGLHVAVTRCNPDGYPEGGWVPGQKISMQDALLAYTEGGAFASFEEDVKGIIEPGYLADLVVLSQDLFSIDPLQTHKTKVVLTIFDGQIVYENGELMK